MEHAGVSLKRETFKAMMQYLKDNHYKAIAMRDLAEYIDPAKAAKQPPTANEWEDSSLGALATEEKPYVAPAIKETPNSRLPNRRPARVAKPSKTAPSATNTAAQGDASAPAKGSRPAVFTWNKAEGGNWSDASKWSNDLGDGSAPQPGGRADYLLKFKMPGTQTVTNDLGPGFLLNRLDLTPVQGNGMTLAGNSIALTANRAGAQPSIRERTIFGRDKITAPLVLTCDLALDLVAAGHLTIDGPISGPGGLVYTGGNDNANPSDDINGGPNQAYSVLSIDNSANSYRGGTVINGGTLRMGTNRGLGTGPITLNQGGGFAFSGGKVVNPLVLNGGVIDAGGVEWNGPVTLNGQAKVAGNNIHFNKSIRGPGGFTLIGTWGAFRPRERGQRLSLGHEHLRRPDRRPPRDAVCEECRRALR